MPPLPPLRRLKKPRTQFLARHVKTYAPRARLHNWAFRQLRQFIVYKAAKAGVPVVFVDPANTSRTCPICGHVDKRNRRSQAEFQCRRCGHAGPADVIAARNIRAWARGDAPDGRVRKGSGKSPSYVEGTIAIWCR